MASHLVNRSAHRPVKACTQCKQVKLRCDSREKYPAPCTRCVSRDYQCVVDSSFRRTPARKRVEAMAKELEALKSQLHDDGNHRMTESPSRTEPSQHSPDRPTEPSGLVVLDESGLDYDQFQLDDFVIAKPTVIEIFKLFCAFFYPHFPILNPTISISGIHESSPVLFWTIIAITTCRPMLPSHSLIFERLEEPYLRLFRSEILNAPLPLQTIQALTYRTMWVFPVRSQTSDPSWLYSGLAVNAAMYIGLHRAKPSPSLRSIGVYACSPRVRAHTWLGCFLASTALAKHVGVSAPIKGSADLATIERYVRTYCVPPEFAYQIMINHTLAKFLEMIVESPQETTSISLVNVIETELDSQRDRFPTAWTPRAEMAYLTAKLLLYTTVIIRLHSDRGSREIVMRSALQVAVRIAYLTCTDQGLAYTSPNHTFPLSILSATLPKNHFRILVLSTAFLIRFFVLNAQATQEEQELARNHVAIVQRYLNAHSTDPMDERVRGATLFSVLCRQKPGDLEKERLRVDDRMGASLVYDAIAKGQELRDEEIGHGEVRSTASATEMQMQDTVHMGTGDGLGPLRLDFLQQEDVWGESIWGMFNPLVPESYIAFGGLEAEANPMGENHGNGNGGYHGYNWN